MKIFVASIPYKLSEAELKTMFTQFGQVASVKLITDKESGKLKGFGFVEMPVAEQGQAAISALNEKEVHGRKIAVSEAVDRNPEFPKHKRGYPSAGGDQEIDGNRW